MFIELLATNIPICTHLSQNKLLFFSAGEEEEIEEKGNKLFTLLFLNFNNQFSSLKFATRGEGGGDLNYYRFL